LGGSFVGGEGGDRMEQIQAVLTIVNTVLGVVISMMTLYLFLKARPKKHRRAKLGKDSLVINLTGHPLPSASWVEGLRVWEPDKPPAFNTTEGWGGLDGSLTRLVRELPEDVQKRLLGGDQDIIIVIPGLAPAALLLMVKLLGVTGTLPQFTAPVRGSDGGFQLPEPISLSDYRLKNRLK